MTGPEETARANELAMRPADTIDHRVDVFGYDGRFLYAGRLQPNKVGGWCVFHHDDPRQSPAPAPVEADTATKDASGDRGDRLRRIAELQATIKNIAEGANERADELNRSGQWYVDFNCVDCDADTLYRVLAEGLLEAGWRPPLPEVMHDAGETAEEAVRRLAAEVVGLRQQAPVDALRAEIRAVLAEDWGYSELGITDFMHDQIARLIAIVERDPAPLPDSETERLAAFDRVKARIDEIQQRDRYALVNVNQLADLLRPDGMWSCSFADEGPARAEREANRDG